MIRIKKKDILYTLQTINFLEKYRYLVKQYKNSFPEIMPKIDKKRVYEIISKLGFVPGYKGDSFRLKNEKFGNISFEMTFKLKYAILDPSLIVFEEGELIYGGPWLKLVRELVGDVDYMAGKPTFGSYEELEEMLSIVFAIYSDFKSVLFEMKGITISER
ncbi:MAG: hypothetical protein K5679_01165 [Lachnospiraceae bacterium]|nr:hypothetical protein [Lachnospiraceae bacterium]